MNKNKEFVINTLILFLGKFATQFISLLLLPLYTHYLITDDFGIVDLLQTYITLFVPLLILRIDSAIFRFLIDVRNDEIQKKQIISNNIFLLVLSLIISLIAGIIVINIFNIKYALLVIINIFSLMISNVFLQILRGLGKNLHYSISSIITGIITLLINIVLIVFYNWNASSILLSSIIANSICSLYVVFACKLYKYIDFKLVKKEEIKTILKYSLPMIPNSLSWWIVNVSDRTIITTILGSGLNGIYSVSCKFSNILNSIFSIFNMSWQESASLHINDEDRDVFFSNMINKLFFIFFSCSLGIIVIIPLLFDILIGREYLEAYKYIPLILYGNVWNILISLIGGIYVAKKKTKEISNTTIISAIINIIVNICLIANIGLYAACISTIIAYMIMGIYRYVDCKKYVNLKLKIKKLVLVTIVFIISSFIYFINNVYLNIINLIFIVIFICIINKELVLITFKYLRNKVLIILFKRNVVK